MRVAAAAGIRSTWQKPFSSHGGWLYQIFFLKIKSNGLNIHRFQICYSRNRGCSTMGDGCSKFNRLIIDSENLIQVPTKVFESSYWSAVILLVGRQQGHPACENVLLCWWWWWCHWSFACHRLSDYHHLHLHHLLLQQNPGWFDILGNRLIQVVLECRPLKRECARLRERLRRLCNTVIKAKAKFTILD